MKRKETSSVQTFDCQNVFPKPEEDKSKSTRTKKAFAAYFTQEKARYIKKSERERTRERKRKSGNFTLRTIHRDISGHIFPVCQDPRLADTGIKRRFGTRYSFPASLSWAKKWKGISRINVRINSNFLIPCLYLLEINFCLYLLHTYSPIFYVAASI